MESHPLNPNARRGPNGIWNEESLPVMDWEFPEKRLVLPESLQRALDLPDAPVLRWDAVKYWTVVTKHARDLPIIDDLSTCLDQWAYVGTETVTGNVRVLFSVDGRWYAVSIGKRQGEHTVISVFGGSDQRFLGNRLRGLNQPKQRGK